MPHSVILVIDQGVKQQKKIKKKYQTAAKIYLFGAFWPSCNKYFRYIEANTIFRSCWKHYVKMRVIFKAPSNICFFQIRLDIIFDSSIDSFL